MGLRCVPELDNQRVAIECRLHKSSQDTGATPVDQPDLAQAGMVGCRDVLVDERSGIRGRERVEVERRFDRDVDGEVGIAHGC